MRRVALLMLIPFWIVLSGATFTWDHPMQRTDGTPLPLSEIAGTTLYRAAQSGGPYAQFAIIAAPGTTYQAPDTEVVGQFFVATTSDTAGRESAFSTEATLPAAGDPPGPPTGLTVVLSPGEKMAQYSTLWTEYTLAAQPSDWTERWNPDNFAATVESVTTPVGSRILRVDGSSGRYVLSWDAIDADADRDDVEVLVLIRLAGTIQANRTSAGVVVRASGAGGSETGYAAAFRAANPSTNRFNRIVEYSNGSFSEVGNDADTWDVNTWYWVRFQVIGSALKMKRWTGTVDDEPGTWDIEATDSTLSAAGWVGVHMNGGDPGPYEYAYVAVGTNGGSAPAPAAAAVSVPIGGERGKKDNRPAA